MKVVEQSRQTRVSSVDSCSIAVLQFMGSGVPAIPRAFGTVAPSFPERERDRHVREDVAHDGEFIAAVAVARLLLASRGSGAGSARRPRAGGPPRSLISD